MSDIKTDMVNHPPHYKDASGIECIEVTTHMQFCGGNCFKYLYRAGKKGSTVEDLKKAAWYANKADEFGEQVTVTTRNVISVVANHRPKGNVHDAMVNIMHENWKGIVALMGYEITRLESEAADD